MSTKIENFDVLSYLQSRNINYKHSGDNVSSGWIGISCLFCIDHSNHMGISLKTKAFNCYKCAETGSAVKLVQTIEGISSIKQVFTIIEEFTGGQYTPKEKHYQSKVLLPSGTSKKLTPNHINYLIKRKFDPEAVTKQYDLYGTGPLGDFKHRLIIPVKMNNRLLSFVGRDISGKSELPYRNSSDTYSIKDVKQCLYNIDSILQNKAVIVEGIFDAWRIGDGAVATFGTKYTHEQLRLLRGLKRAYVLYDSDAIPLAHKLAHDLSAIVPSVEVLELDAGDPDAMSEDDVRALRRDLKL